MTLKKREESVIHKAHKGFVYQDPPLKVNCGCKRVNINIAFSSCSSTGMAVGWLAVLPTVDSFLETHGNKRYCSSRL
jgi:hypothetical protein